MLRLFLILAMLVGFNAVLPCAYAQAKYSIKQMTLEVEAALDNRRERFDELRGLKQSGAIGENNKGYVEALSGDSSVRALASAENKDRRTIYQTIAQQNGLQSAISAIEEVFAQVQRDKAESGDKIQTPEGQWIAK